MEFEDKPVEKIIIPYDSLSNFHREKYGDKYTYHHLIGQTIMYVGDASTRSLGETSFPRGTYFTIDSILPDQISKGKYNILALTNINTGESTTATSGINVKETYNRQWVVLGYYLKLKELYQGKSFVYKGIPSDFYRYSVTSLYDFRLIPSNETLNNVPINSIWECIDVQVVPRKPKDKYEYLEHDLRNNVALIFENAELGKAFCYVEDEYGTPYSADHYLFKEKAKNYVCGRFMPKDEYDADIAAKKAAKKRQNAARARQLEKQRQQQADENRRSAQRQAARRSSILSKYGETNGNRILNGEIWIGMTAQMCRDAIGNPYKVNRTRTAYNNHEQWIYGSKYIYFDNGISNDIQY